MDGEPTCNGGGNTFCAIYLDNNNDVPTSIPITIKSYIASAQATMIPQPVNGGTAIRFVYVHYLGL